MQLITYPVSFTPTSAVDDLSGVATGTFDDSLLVSFTPTSVVEDLTGVASSPSADNCVAVKRCGVDCSTWGASLVAKATDANDPVFKDISSYQTEPSTASSSVQHSSPRQLAKKLSVDLTADRDLPVQHMEQVPSGLAYHLDANALDIRLVPLIPRARSASCTEPARPCRTERRASSEPRSLRHTFTATSNEERNAGSGLLQSPEQGIQIMRSSSCSSRRSTSRCTSVCSSSFAAAEFEAHSEASIAPISSQSQPRTSRISVDLRSERASESLLALLQEHCLEAPDTIHPLRQHRSPPRSPSAPRSPSVVETVDSFGTASVATSSVSPAKKTKVMLDLCSPLVQALDRDCVDRISRLSNCPSLPRRSLLHTAVSDGGLVDASGHVDLEIHRGAPLVKCEGAGVESTPQTATAKPDTNRFQQRYLDHLASRTIECGNCQQGCAPDVYVPRDASSNYSLPLITNSLTGGASTTGSLLSPLERFCRSATFEFLVPCCRCCIPSRTARRLISVFLLLLLMLVVTFGLSGAFWCWMSTVRQLIVGMEGSWCDGVTSFR